jgi:hypothetical protein
MRGALATFTCPWEWAIGHPLSLVYEVKEVSEIPLFTNKCYKKVCLDSTNGTVQGKVVRVTAAAQSNTFVPLAREEWWYLEVAEAISTYITPPPSPTNDPYSIPEFSTYITPKYECTNKEYMNNNSSPPREPRREA